MMSRNRGPTKHDWENIRSIFTRLYSHEDKTLDETKNYLAAHYGFKAHTSVFKYHIREWKLNKYHREEDMRTLIRLARQRRALGDYTCFTLRGRKLELFKAIEYFRRRRIDIHAPEFDDLSHPYNNYFSSNAVRATVPRSGEETYFNLLHCPSDVPDDKRLHTILVQLKLFPAEVCVERLALGRIYISVYWNDQLFLVDTRSPKCWNKDTTFDKIATNIREFNWGVIIALFFYLKHYLDSDSCQTFYYLQFVAQYAAMVLESRNPLRIIAHEFTRIKDSMRGIVQVATRFLESTMGLENDALFGKVKMKNHSSRVMRGTRRKREKYLNRAHAEPDG